jgi:hypothetical protein
MPQLTGMMALHAALICCNGSLGPGKFAMDYGRKYKEGAH